MKLGTKFKLKKDEKITGIVVGIEPISSYFPDPIIVKYDDGNPFNRRPTHLTEKDIIVDESTT